PNGVGPLDVETSGPCATPLASSAYVSIFWVVFSVTTNHFPSGVNATSAPPGLALLNGLVEPAIACNPPCVSSLKPEILAVPPAFSAYTRSCCAVTLTGLIPPEGTRLTTVNMSSLASSTEMSLLPPLTAKSQRPLSL